jgi:hypothetical protein
MQVSYVAVYDAVPVISILQSPVPRYNDAEEICAMVLSRAPT